MDIGWSHLGSGTIGGALVGAVFVIRELARGKVKISFGVNGNGNGASNGQPCRFQCNAPELKPTLERLASVLERWERKEDMRDAIRESHS